VPDGCGSAEYMCDISACAEFNIVCTWLYFGEYSLLVIQYTFCDQSAAFAVCVTVMYWEMWENKLPRGGNCQIFTSNFQFDMSLV
jgi:hypothetical protein